MGHPSQGQTDSWSPFKVLLIGFIAYFAIGQFVSMLTLSYMNIDEKTGTYDGTIKQDAPDWVFLTLSLNHMLKFLYGIYLLFLVMRTRAHIRKTYNIPEQNCGGMEDCCTAYWCGCCSVAQMARHTADYKTYAATCCTETGLGENTPPTIDPTIV